MELLSHEQLDANVTPEANLPSYSYCPNCFSMMNEIMELRMELGRVNESEKKVKKNFTIAPTLYTFYRNGLAKRNLARLGLEDWYQL